jgi:hypothetical protein
MGYLTLNEAVSLNWKLGNKGTDRKYELTKRRTRLWLILQLEKRTQSVLGW